MAYIGKTPTPAPLTSSDIAADIINSTHIGDTAISGFDALATAPADTDEFLISDGGVLKRLDASLIGGGASNAFWAYDMSGNASGDLVLSTELFDDGGNYNTSNGRYTAPSDGKYLFMAAATPSSSTTNILFKKNGSGFAGGTDMFGYSPNNSTQGHAHVILDLSASDYVNLNTNNSSYNNYIYFGGVKLY